MARLLEIAVGEHAADAGMHEMCAVGIFARQRGHVVVGSAAERPRAECQSVVLIGHGVEEPLDILVAGDDARQSEYLQRGVVGMHAHVNAILVAHGHDGLEEIFHVLAQLVAVDAVVEREQLAEGLDGCQVIFRDIAVDESLGLDDDVLDQTVLLSGSRCV